METFTGASRRPALVAVPSACWWRHAGACVCLRLLCARRCGSWRRPTPRGSKSWRRRAPAPSCSSRRCAPTRFHALGPNAQICFWLVERRPPSAQQRWHALSPRCCVFAFRLLLPPFAPAGGDQEHPERAADQRERVLLAGPPLHHAVQPHLRRHAPGECHERLPARSSTRLSGRLSPRLSTRWFERLSTRLWDRHVLARALARICRLPRRQARGRKRADMRADTHVDKRLLKLLPERLLVTPLSLALSHPPSFPLFAARLPPRAQVYKLYSELISQAIADGGPYAARSQIVKYMRRCGPQRRCAALCPAGGALCPPALCTGARRQHASSCRRGPVLRALALLPGLQSRPCQQRPATGCSRAAGAEGSGPALPLRLRAPSRPQRQEGGAAADRDLLRQERGLGGAGHRLRARHDGPHPGRLRARRARRQASA